MSRNKQPPRPCSIEDCGKPAKARGWCGMHWARWRIKGSPHIESNPRLARRRILGIGSGGCAVPNVIASANESAIGRRSAHLRRVKAEMADDRALDAAIAEQLFGLRIARGIVVGDDGRPLMDIPAYSSSWQQAGMVIEEMQRRGFALRMYEGVPGTVAFAEWYAPPHNGEADFWTATAYTFPEAIAKAALAALGTPVEEAKG